MIKIFCWCANIAFNGKRQADFRSFASIAADVGALQSEASLRTHLPIGGAAKQGNQRVCLKAILRTVIIDKQGVFYG